MLEQAGRQWSEVICSCTVPQKGEVPRSAVGPARACVGRDGTATLRVRVPVGLPGPRYREPQRERSAAVQTGAGRSGRSPTCGRDGGEAAHALQWSCPAASARPGRPAHGSRAWQSWMLTWSKSGAQGERPSLSGPATSGAALTGCFARARSTTQYHYAVLALLVPLRSTSPTSSSSSTTQYKV